MPISSKSGGRWEIKIKTGIKKKRKVPSLDVGNNSKNQLYTFLCANQTRLLFSRKPTQFRRKPGISANFAHACITYEYAFCTGWYDYYMNLRENQVRQVHQEKGRMVLCVKMRKYRRAYVSHYLNLLQLTTGKCTHTYMLLFSLYKR